MLNTLPSHRQCSSLDWPAKTSQEVGGEHRRHLHVLENMIILAGKLHGPAERVSDQVLFIIFPEPATLGPATLFAAAQ